jgi:hypothetical protein
MPPGNPPAPAKVTSLTDPTAAWTNKGQRKVGFAYGANYLIDLQQAIIVDAEATPACWSAEVAATKTVLERTRERFGLHPQRLAADVAYGSGLMIRCRVLVQNNCSNPAEGDSRRGRRL